MMSSIYITQEVVEISSLAAMGAEPDWRAIAISKLHQHGLTVVNPIDWALTRETESEIGIEKRVRRALDLIDQCDAVLANLNKSNYGTAMEIFYAHRQGKTVTVVGQPPFSPWILQHSQARFEDMSRAIGFLIEEGMQPDVLNRALQFESHLQERSEQFPSGGEGDYQFFGGEMPILVFAPHATSYFREGDFKEADAYTGSLAASVNRTSLAHALVSSYCMAADPCCYTETPMIRTLAEVVKTGQIGLVVAVVGAAWHESHAFTIETYGTEGSTYATLLRERLSELDEVGTSRDSDDVRVLQRFITEQLSVPSIVLRVNRRFRMPKLQPEAFLALNAALSRFVRECGWEMLRSAS
ncbi:MAG: nucleoside 2-deoxyribosyltransferase [Candidatus Obscuribacterales bacterium]|nr:nucleoside 2-deoxyribosyltransferase [Candidatus Obscuribacterales bacterium]